MNWGDAVTGFQQGTVDGQENPMGILLPVQIWQYHKHVTRWNYLADPLILYWNKKEWDRFPADIQEALAEAAAEATRYQKALARAKQIAGTPQEGKSRPAPAAGKGQGTEDFDPYYRWLGIPPEEQPPNHYALLGIRDKKSQIAMADEVIRQGMSVRALEAAVREHSLGKPGGSNGKGKPARKRDRAAWLTEIEECLTETLSTVVSVRYGNKKSVIQIECAGRDEFERIYGRLKEC